MFGRRHVGGIWKPKNPHSLEYLKYLYGVLNKNAVVTENNRGLLVEALRAIAEILIWGDQNDPSVFDFFLEKNMLGYFLRIMRQKCGRYVCTQLLQTLNILFENISNETSLYYLLSNNHVNSIVTHRFDFSDEEILAYYISFLKTLSMKLNNNTIHFFFNEHTNDFPLYTEAIKFFNHPEGMVRIAVRTLTLNVYRVNDPAMLSFIRDNAAAPYFANFVFFIVKHVVDLDACAVAADCANAQTRYKLSDLVAEHLDHIHYMNDVMRLGIDSLNDVLAEQLVTKLLAPVYLGSLLPPSFQLEGSVRVSPAIALFLLSQLFLVVTHAPLVHRLARLLFEGDAESLAREASAKSGCRTDAKCSSSSAEASAAGPAATEANNKTDDEKLNKTHPLTTDRPMMLARVLDLLDCSAGPIGDDHAAFFALCLIISVCQNRSVDQQAVVAPHSARMTSRLVGMLSRAAAAAAAMKDAAEEEPSAPKGGRLRTATAETCSSALKHFVSETTEDRTRVAADLKPLLEALLDRLREDARRDPVFLDLFEDEYRRWQAGTGGAGIGPLSTDPAMLCPPCDTALSGVDLDKRLPCGPQEHVRHGIRLMLIIRDLVHHMSGQEDPFRAAFRCAPTVALDDCLNLSNSDLLACTVVAKDGTRCQRFLVTGGLQLMLVEPDSAKLGYGVVRFTGFLQECQVAGDKDDSRALTVTVLARQGQGHTQGGQPGHHHGQSSVSVRMTFDDHIRCMAAKQRLTKGRQQARQYRMAQLSGLLGLGSGVSAAAAASAAHAPLRGVDQSGFGGPAVPGFVALDRSSSTSIHHQQHRDRAADTAAAPTRAIGGSGPGPAPGPSSGSGRRRVRVLSAQGLVPGGAHCPQQVDPQEVELENGGGKRSSSLSPRVVPRFGVPSSPGAACDQPRSPPGRAAAASGSSSSKTGVVEEDGIEMKAMQATVPVINSVEPASTSNVSSGAGGGMQRFVGPTRKAYSQILDV